MHTSHLKKEVSVLLRLFPRGSYEPSEIVFNETSPGLGFICAPPAPTAEEIVMNGLPHCAHFGRPLSFDLVLRKAVSVSEIDAILKTISLHTIVDVRIMQQGVESPKTPSLLDMSFEVFPVRSCVVVSVQIPLESHCEPMMTGDAGRWEVVLLSVSVAGLKIFSAFASESRYDGLSGENPIRIPLEHGITAPQCFRWEKRSPQTFNTLTSPAVTPDGVLYLPLHESPVIRVYAADGIRLPDLSCKDFGLSQYSSVSAFHESSGTLFVADWINAPHTKLVAIDVASEKRRWASADSVLNRCRGIAVLESAALVVASSHESRVLQVFCIADGRLVATVRSNAGDADRADGRPESLASIPGTAILFASVDGKVLQFEWTGITLEARGLVQSAVLGNAASNADRPLTVIPGSHAFPPCLVVGEYATSKLLVISLPDYRLIHSHDLGAGVKVSGLAADPSERALIVCNQLGECVEVLQWPFPSMASMAMAMT